MIIFIINNLLFDLFCELPELMDGSVPNLVWSQLRCVGMEMK